METITLSAVLFTGTCSKKFQHFVKGVGGGVGVGVTLSPLKKALAFNNVNRGP